jgi:predicted  nucleic acid-binding Zn-ribbon protein
MSTPLQESLRALLALQAVDSQIQRLMRSQKALDDGAAAQTSLRAARTASDSAASSLHRVAGELKDSELKLSGVESKKKQFEQKLWEGKVTNPKELTNIEKEIAALGRQRGDLDGQVLQLMDDVEAAQKEAAVAAAAAKEATERHTEIVAHFRANYKEIERKLAGLRAERENAVAAVPDRALFARYEDICKKHAGLGIVTVADGDCGGCHMTLPNALVKSVRDAEILQICENCRRILAP